MGMESRIQLHFDVTRGKIGIATQAAQLALSNSFGRLSLFSEAATFDTGKTQGDLSIDQYPSRYSYNIKTIPDLLADAVQSGFQTALATIGRIAENGDRIAAVEKGTTIAAIAVEEGQPPSSEIDLISIARPRVDYQLSRSDGRFRQGRISGDLQRGSVENRTQKTIVDTKILQYPSIRFWTSGQIDIKA